MGLTKACKVTIATALKINLPNVDFDYIISLEPTDQVFIHIGELCRVKKMKYTRASEIYRLIHRHEYEIREAFESLATENNVHFQKFEHIRTSALENRDNMQVSIYLCEETGSFRELSVPVSEMRNTSNTVVTSEYTGDPGDTESIAEHEKSHRDIDTPEKVPESGSERVDDNLSTSEDDTDADKIKYSDICDASVQLPKFDHEPAKEDLNFDDVSMKTKVFAISSANDMPKRKQNYPYSHHLDSLNVNFSLRHICIRQRLFSIAIYCVVIFKGTHLRKGKTVEYGTCKHTKCRKFRFEYTVFNKIIETVVIRFDKKESLHGTEEFAKILRTLILMLLLMATGIR